MKNLPIKAADILLPKSDFEKWAVVACDQYTSQPEYWEECDRIAGETPSTLRIILPEVYLEDNIDARIENINAAMKKYLDSGVLAEYKDTMIYIERTLRDGRVRRGLVAAIDLEAYDFNRGATSLIRATEGTVLERIPPRVKIRIDAPIELPHVMLLIDDDKKSVIEPISSRKGDLDCLYDFALMMEGGSICGYALDDAEKTRVLDAIGALAVGENPLLFAVGDGNHSLATAKTCYEKNGRRPEERFALVELVNIHDDALEFEPIYRVLFGCDPDDVISTAKKELEGRGDDTQTIEYYTAKENGKLEARPAANLPVGTLQAFIDKYIASHSGVTVDYIHGEDVTKELAKKEGCVGFIFRGMEKSQLFETVKKDGALPRKTFSMGEACDKRYYLEARRIK